MARSLAALKRDKRVADAYRDSDGVHIELRAGWTADPLDAHDIHEDTMAQALRKFKRVVACHCEGCCGNELPLAARKMWA